MLAEISALTLGDIATYAPYVVGVPVAGFFSWKAMKIGRRMFGALEETPGRTTGSFLTFLGLTLGPFLSLSLLDSNLGAGLGAAGGSVFLLVMGVLLMVQGHKSNSIEGQRRDYLLSAQKMVKKIPNFTTDDDVRNYVRSADERIELALQRKLSRS